MTIDNLPVTREFQQNLNKIDSQSFFLSTLAKINLKKVVKELKSGSLKNNQFRDSRFQRSIDTN